MASQLPDKLKKADLHRFATRAAQLERFRPIITYWCEYYILQQILGKGLHTGDDECSNYAVQLMDKLETTKASNASNDAIIDDVAAKAYIENFALETFNKADESQKSNKVTKQTADTFMAAGTFMDLLSIWGEVDKELLAKQKFAKYHAMRILKAFKAGEDPNATNPVVEEPPAPAEDGLDAELQALESQQNGPQGGTYQPPSVEAASPSSAFANNQPPPPLSSQTPHEAAPSAPPANEYEVSPIEPPAAVESPNARQNSVGGGYFPSIPGAQAQQAPDPAQPTSQPMDMDPQNFYNTTTQQPAPAAPSAPAVPSPSTLGMSSPVQPVAPPPHQMNAQPPVAPPPVQYQQPPQMPVQQHVAPPAPAPAVAQQPPPVAGYKTDDESTMAAQKHARWAISALNFEDVNTAVKELRLALQNLGAG